MRKLSVMTPPEIILPSVKAGTPECFHCGEPEDGSSTFISVIEGHERPMCCACYKAVTGLIVESGMTHF